MDSKYNAILNKLHKMKTENDSKLGQILTQTANLQTKVGTFMVNDDVSEVKLSMDFMNETVEKLEDKMKVKVEIKFSCTY